MPLTPVQKGRSLILGNVPTFAEVVIMAGTWNEHDVTPQGIFEGASGLENITTSDKTRKEVSPTWMTITGQTPLEKGSSILETSAGARKWVVTDMSTDYDVNGRAVHSGAWVYDETLSAAIS